MPFGKDSSGAKPVFLPGQKELAGEVLMSVLGPMVLGGAPDAATEINNARGREGLNQTLATQGLSGSGLAAKAAATLEQGNNANTARQRFDMINRVFGSLGQSSSGSGFQIGGS
jgi:hypothetical protein